MFIRLGNTKINYRSASTNTYMLFSEVVNSSLSYETPVVISNISELNALFGKDYDDYVYLKRMIESHNNVGLHLFKPFSPTKTKITQEREGFIDYSNYTVINPYNSLFTLPLEYLDYFEEWRNDPTMAIRVFINKDKSKGTGFLRYDGTWKVVENPEHIFKGETLEYNNEVLNQLKYLRENDNICLLLENEKYIFCGDDFGFILESNLPQNMGSLRDSEDLDNRSTLFIPKDSSKISYVQPEYQTGKGLGVYSIDNLPILKSLDNIHIDKIRERRETLALRLKMVENKFEKGVFGFLDISDKEKKKAIILYSGKKPTEDIIDGEIVYINFPNNTKYTDATLKLLSSYLGANYPVIKDGDDYIICGVPMIDLGYNTFTGFTVEPDYEISQLILYKTLTKTDNSGIQFWSKTIGGTEELDEDGIIKIQVEKAEYDDYLFIISRYNYQETFQGSLKTVFGIDRIDNIISKNSKLIYMNIAGDIDKIETGTYYMSSGKYFKDYDKSYWMNSLKMMFEEDNKIIKPDFLLIPNIQDYISNELSPGTHYSPEHKTILKYCIDNEFQALIQNSVSKYSCITIKSEDLDTIKNPEDNVIYHIPGKTSYIKYISDGDEIEITGDYKLKYNIESKSFIGKQKTDVRTVIYTEICKSNSTIRLEPSTDITSDYFHDGLYIKFENRSKSKQSVYAPVISNGINSKIFFINPDSSLILKCSHTNGNLDWIDVGNQVTGYFWKGSDGKLTRIENRKIINEAICGGDFTHNFLDNSNRLLYFYESIYTKTYGYRYPGYCIFLEGLLTGNYSGDVNDIMYNPPVTSPYETEPIEKLLELFRCNYLVFNGQKYYYKKYFESSTKSTSIFLRFIIGKVSRELFKNKGNYVGEKVIGKIRQSITEILYKIINTFSIVEKLEITGFETDIKNNLLNIELSTAVKNLVDKDIRLNITLNLNK